MNETNDLIQQLRAQGHRLTPQRRLILEVLQQSSHHLSAEEIGQTLHAQYPTIAIDHATIYRTLKWLRDNQLVSETSLGASHMVYALLSRHAHHHLVCERCHKIIEVEPSIFDQVCAELRRRYAFEANFSHVAVFGRCTHCRTS